MQVDPRGQRVSAGITTAVLVVVLITGSWELLAAQAVVFAVGALIGLRYAPYGLIYQALIRPRIGPPRQLEDAAPPRFAQGVGLVFALVGVVGYVVGIEWLGIVATALALGAAFLNAAFGFCLGCEMYLLIRRVIPKNRSDREVPA
ncbi:MULTISPECIES: DUF4395 domain-containing protein [Thermomonospora]|uniref:DUF4395 domain-containing protein n=1 Tax=Thermomonospora curvata (strain ATCC 19995 / DSM 43183 / JCM 3096 / KCTC 9072 / NBRC 15933 / NCIMB 10081 / Henssen B9) TaxID=471852 RepID=D1A4G1_THECD|nr:MULTISPECIES: DUF4395 domain-containing protein [Thermomonospora]ACY96196.1 hypothetical protein Tcur_0601 [Thermomonospora curvata DSM 43183]PKK15626.1 MAG: DUF4395 domain-containing protein [Thermomonospora sp. CIF 1]